MSAKNPQIKFSRQIHWPIIKTRGICVKIKTMTVVIIKNGSKSFIAEENLFIFYLTLLIVRGKSII